MKKLTIVVLVAAFYCKPQQVMPPVKTNALSGFVFLRLLPLMDEIPLKTLSLTASNTSNHRYQDSDAAHRARTLVVH